MKKDRVSQISFLVVFAMLLALLGGAIATAQEPDPEGAIAAVDIGEDWVVWRPQIESAGFSLTISGPDGFYLQQEHQPNNLIILTVKDGEGNPLPSGIYQYELYSLPLAEPIEPDDEQRGLDPPGGAAVRP